MSERQLLNRLNKLKALEEQQAAIKQKIEDVKADIKEYMEHKGIDEQQAGDYTVRFKTIASNKFDTKRFASEHSRLYKQYIKEISSKRFTVA